MTGRHGDHDGDGTANQADPDWAPPDERDTHAVDDAECDEAQQRPDRWLGVTRDPDALARVGRTVDGPVDELGGPLHG